MKMRAAASVALAGTMLLGLTSCEFLAPQQTTRSYAASDGVNGSAGAVDIRNAFLVTLNGTTASLIVSFINTTGAARSVSMQYQTASGPTTQSVEVPANASVPVRPGQQVTITFSDLSTRAGALLPVFFSSGGRGAQLGVPVLDNTLPGYKTLAPSPTPTPTPTRTKKQRDSDETPSPAPSPTDTSDVQPSATSTPSAP